MRLITFLSGPAIRTVLTGMIALTLLLRRQWRDAALLGLAVGGAGAATTGLKKAIDRRRPRPWFHFAQDYESFPSGHASGSVALLGALIYLHWRHTRSRLATTLAAVTGTTLAILAGISRIRLRRHHPGDVAVGYLLGGLCVAAAIRIAPRLDSGSDQPSDVS